MRIKGSRFRWEKTGKELNLTHSQLFSKYVPVLKMNNTRILETKWKTSRKRIEFLPVFWHWKNDLLFQNYEEEGL